MCVHLVHALHVDAVLPTVQSIPSLNRHASRPASASTQLYHGPQQAGTLATPALPFVTADADVIGEIPGADNITAAAGWAGAARGLLHGKRRVSKYTKCSQCTMISCNNEGCTGHCKKWRTFFTCRTNGLVGGRCSRADNPVPIGRTPDPLDPLHSVDITVTAPFIGCANITGLPIGCPAERTRGMSDDGVEFTVAGSSCEQHLVNLSCRKNGTDAPFHPFGYCFCTVLYDGGGASFLPCNLSELDYRAPSMKDTDGVPIRVFPEGDRTVTTYGVREELDLRRYEYNTTFDLGYVTVDVEMVHWGAIQMGGENLTLDGLLEDFH